MSAINVAHLDLIEANEAFAAQACAVNQALGWDTAKVNVNGGAIAIGQPIGASGTAPRLLLRFFASPIQALQTAA